MQVEDLLKWMRKHNAIIAVDATGYDKEVCISVRLSAIRRNERILLNRTITEKQLAQDNFPALTDAVEDMIEQFDRDKGE